MRHFRDGCESWGYYGHGLKTYKILRPYTPCRIGDCTQYVIGWTIHTIYMSESVLLFHRICTFLFESLLKKYAMSSPRSKLIAHMSIPVYFCHVYNMSRTIIRSMVEISLSYPLSPIPRPSSDEYKKSLSSPHFPPPSERHILFSPI